MTWGEFHSAVMSFLGDDAEDTNPVKIRQIDQAMRSACIRMQQVINNYRAGHETIYEVDDMTVEGYAHRAEIPDGANLLNLWRYDAEESGSEDSDCDPERITLSHVDWKDRMSMVTGETRDRDIWTINPNSNRFYICPMLETGETLHLFWNGLKINFDEDDVLPWGEEAAVTVSHFINAELARQSKDKAGNYQSFRTDWQLGLALLSANEVERKVTND